MPFVKALQGVMKKAAPGLKKSGLYNPKTRNRQCFMQVKWRYQHEKLSKIVQKNMFVTVRMGDYRLEKGQHTIFWGMTWWGNSKDAMTVFHLFEKIKDGYEIEMPERGSRGASVQAVRLLAKKYTARQVLSLEHDIKEEIVADLVKMVGKMAEALGCSPQ